VVGAKAGTAAFGALVHYVATICALGIVVAVAGPLAVMAGARIGMGRFVRAALPAQAVAISTQSSLASLPAMLKGADSLGVPVPVAGLILPLAAAMFRWTGPAMNLGVAIYVARWFGVAMTPGTIVAAVAVAGLTSLGTVSLPGQISFVSAVTPIAAVLGAPTLPLGLLVAVETIPDIIRTVGNVTMDIAVTRRLAGRVTE
jgi:Na+/H+-dicarboxylate symporter